MDITNTQHPLSIAVVGSGISGMAAAWLLSKNHRVTVYEKNDRIGGHSNTATVETASGMTAVDTGFIVYNERNYPNLTALFEHLGVPTKPSDMSFSASLDDGRFEYSGSGLGGLFAQPRNLLRPRMWSMLRDLRRFYQQAPQDVAQLEGTITLGEYLEKNRYGRNFIHDHLLPMGAAIWSTPVDDMLDYPLEAFVRFCSNHGLLQLRDCPAWRTVSGGSREYVRRLTEPYAGQILLNMSEAQSRSALIRMAARNITQDQRTPESDLLSYLLFDGDFCAPLAELGFADARAKEAELAAFFTD